MSWRALAVQVEERARAQLQASADEALATWTEVSPAEVPRPEAAEGSPAEHSGPTVSPTPAHPAPAGSGPGAKDAEAEFLAALDDL